MQTQLSHLADPAGHPVIKSYHSVLPPQTRPYREHRHTECELALFLRGSGLYTLPDRVYQFAPGDVFLFAGSELHCITEIREDMEILNIHFEPRLLWERPESAELLALFHARSDGFTHKIPASDPIPGRLMRELEAELAGQAPGAAIMARYQLFSALVHLIRNYDFTDSASNKHTPAALLQSMERAMAYINSHITEPLTLKSIAREAMLSPAYFSSLFGKYNGIALWDYITIKRIEAAIVLLRTTNLTKLEIAGRCGFSSSSNFYKAFAAVTGRKPGDYSQR